MFFCYQQPPSRFHDLAARFLENASYKMSCIPSIGNFIAYVCFDERKLLRRGQVISQGSVYLSQILDPAPLAQIKTFSDALQVYQAVHFFGCRSFITSENIGCFEIVVVNSFFVKGFEQACQCSQHGPSFQVTVDAF